MQLILVRHGRPERIENSDEPADPALTALGLRQAEAMATWLAEERIDKLYVSPMVRARQTCEPLEQALGQQATVVDDVREFDAEERSYIPMEEVKADSARWREFLRTEVAADRSGFQNDVGDALDAIVDDNKGATVAVICHGGVINAWAARILDHPRVLFFEPDYTSINRFMAASSGQRSILSLNETGHLRGVEA